MNGSKFSSGIYFVLGLVSAYYEWQSLPSDMSLHGLTASFTANPYPLIATVFFFLLSTYSSWRSKQIYNDAMARSAKLVREEQAAAVINENKK